MPWFFFALICILGWGFADLFYKKSADEADRFSHLKTSIWVGLVMGLCSLLMLRRLGGFASLGELAQSALRYTPASLSYIISMTVGYAGLRYLELSIISPVQNASGALSALAMLLYFTATGRITSVTDEFSALDLAGTAFIVVSVIALAIVEQRLSRKEQADPELPAADRKYRFGALALLFPLLYCLFDTLGTAADGIILDGEQGLRLGEIDVIILYGLTFFLVAVVLWIFLWIRTGKPYNPFAKSELPKACAAGCEEFGQIFYVYAMARNPVLAAPLVASYCVVSMLLDRVVLKEKLRPAQYLCIAGVVIGIVMLGISEGING